MKNVLHATFFSIVFSICVNAQEASDFSLRGSNWFGGSASFSSLGISGADERISILRLAPILRYFPADHFMVGPSFSWTGMFADGDGMNQLGIGIDIGGVFSANSKSGKTLYPYIRSGGGVVIISADDESVTGFNLPIAGGLIIPIADVFAFHIEPSFSITFIEGENLNTFGISIGACGLGKKTAISVLQGMSGMPSLF